jgi:hypothetical protein
MKNTVNSELSSMESSLKQSNSSQPVTRKWEYVIVVRLRIACYAVLGDQYKWWPRKTLFLPLWSLQSKGSRETYFFKCNSDECDKGSTWEKPGCWESA